MGNFLNYIDYVELNLILQSQNRIQVNVIDCSRLCITSPILYIVYFKIFIHIYVPILCRLHIEHICNVNSYNTMYADLFYVILKYAAYICMYNVILRIHMP